MEERRYRRRRGGSLVFPVLLIVIGVLFLLDNLNITSGIDWSTIWKLWPVILIAIGVEVMLGRRVSFGAVFLVVIIVIVGGAVLWWSIVVGDKDWTTQHFVWPTAGVERAELELRIGVGELQLTGQSDMGDLLIADLELAPGVEVNERVRVDDDVARGRISSERDAFALPRILGNRGSEWDVRLNTRVSWEMNIDSGVGEVTADLSDLRVGELQLESGAGGVDLVLPRRGPVRARVDGGIGDLRITIPEGVQARIRVDRGIGSLNVGSRFKRRGDYYETEDFSTAESFIDLDIDIGAGSVTVR